MAPMTIGAVCALVVALYGVPDPASERIYGRVLTSDGETLEGYLRWDRNEASWSDFLDGAKEIPRAHQREAESLDPEFAEQRRLERSIEAFGVRLMWDEDDESDPLTSRSSIRFGHIASLEPLDRRSAMLELRSGTRVRLESSSSDIGVALRSLVVEERNGAETELRWRELERVDFMQAPEGMPAPAAARLHGTVRTSNGLELTGNITWDLDETVETDILDGSVGREDYEIPFTDIAAIEWESTRSSRVRLTDGDELVLRGTNDVDRSNRGIEVSDPLFGRAIVHWEDFEAVTFHAPDGAALWESFDGGAPLQGTVEARDGRTITGEIRWDNDEEAGWETLDGWAGGVEFDIEFGAVASVQRLDDERVRVVLVDGREVELEDDDDVSDGNRGIFVKPPGRARRLVRWRDFDRVVFTR